jgi:hypothetical protein
MFDPATKTLDMINGCGEEWVEIGEMVGISGK